ncbi:tetratricopeptide repeat protein [Dethiosulfatarculus sandiegensis]|uniref:tetratricopeptide repeat protein n=1 Tax=Dethiosulfatarculus sandiegensis TaxID=1429043 RepID=UPI0006978C67|nr:tetratricopeptide repeat protein [Dethiosulfatarculus sandiegensis]
MKTAPYICVLISAFFFSGCSLMMPPRFPPETTPEAQKETQPETQSQAGQPKPPNTAVVALLDKAHLQSSTGNPAAAGASLERALRIEPRNPVLWSELAKARLDQGRYRQAINLAAKSNSLARGKEKLRTKNWRIIGRARNKLGDYKGAEAAFKRAEQGR